MGVRYQVGCRRAPSASHRPTPRQLGESVDPLARWIIRAGEAVARLVRLGFVEVDGLDLHPHSAHGAGTARRVLRDVGG